MAEKPPNYKYMGDFPANNVRFQEGAPDVNAAMNNWHI
jgi:hypothetical protein